MAVIICAYSDDRWDQTLDAVRSVIAQDEPPDEVLVVVDHNPGLAMRLRNHGLRTVTVLDSEESRGLSGARNTGLHHASSEIVAFLDDDASAAQGWVHDLKAIYMSDSSVVAVGGSVVPRWLGIKPSWFPDEFSWVIGCSYEGQPTKRMEVRNLLGCNMSVRRMTDRALPSFSHLVGRSERRLLSCDETQFFIDLGRTAPDLRIVYEPHLTVRHLVPPDRLTLGYFIWRCWSEGLSKAVVARSTGTATALSVERGYVRHTLVVGVGRRLSRGIGSRDAEELAQAGAIVLGLLTTIWGFLIGSSRCFRRGPAP